ncbi:hypothetical protein MHYP_G00209910 [Metynnis hypsauchen]
MAVFVLAFLKQVLMLVWSQNLSHCLFHLFLFLLVVYERPYEASGFSVFIPLATLKQLQMAQDSFLSLDAGSARILLLLPRCLSWKNQRSDLADSLL